MDGEAGLRRPGAARAALRLRFALGCSAFDTARAVWIPGASYQHPSEAGRLGLYRPQADYRLFDGVHTVVGAVNAARGAFPDDRKVEETPGWRTRWRACAPVGTARIIAK